MLFYKPGLLAGGSVEHVCNPQRSIGYYLEAVVLLAPFCKKPIRLNLKGVTNDRYDPTVCKKSIICATGSEYSLCSSRENPYFLGEGGFKS